jgi:gas vesicle protein
VIDIFKRLAPSYANIVRKLAIDVWYERADFDKFLESAERFKMRYERELAEHYRRLRYPFRPSQIRDLADQWLADQITIFGKVQEVSDEKKKNLQIKLDDTKDKKREEVSQLIEKAKRHEGRIARVVSFSENLEKRSEQIGEDQAFELATKINHHVVEQISGVYQWKTQEDSRVRKTHRKLANKIFAYDDPPTTIDEYGHTHTGHPGTDWGCRCWEEAAKGKPLRGYTVRG